MQFLVLMTQFTASNRRTINSGRPGRSVTFLSPMKPVTSSGRSQNCPFGLATRVAIRACSMFEPNTKTEMDIATAACLKGLARFGRITSFTGEFLRKNVAELLKAV